MFLSLISQSACTVGTHTQIPEKLSHAKRKKFHKIPLGQLGKEGQNLKQDGFKFTGYMRSEPHRCFWKLPYS